VNYPTQMKQQTTGNLSLEHRAYSSAERARPSISPLPSNWEKTGHPLEHRLTQEHDDVLQRLFKARRALCLQAVDLAQELLVTKKRCEKCGQLPGIEFLQTWMRTKNPILGGIAPLEMLKLGYGVRLADFIERAHEENRSPDEPTPQYANIGAMIDSALAEIKHLVQQPGANYGAACGVGEGALVRAKELIERQQSEPTHGRICEEGHVAIKYFGEECPLCIEVRADALMPD
jgi:hypothetical protein